MRALLVSALLSVLLAPDANYAGGEIGRGLSSAMDGDPQSFARFANGESPRALKRVGLAATENLQVEVDATVTYDQQTNRYTYSYRVRNLPTSSDTVDVFALRPVFDLESIGAPDHWGSYPHFQEDFGALAWMTEDPGPAPPGWMDDSVNVYRSAYSILPGDTLAGFTIVTENSPATVEFLARKIEIPLPLVEDVNEQVPPPPLWIGAVGTTTGPNGSIGVPDEDSVPGRRQGLLRPTPNPVTRSTTITFDLPTAAEAELEMRYAWRGGTASLGSREMMPSNASRPVSISCASSLTASRLGPGRL